MTDNIRYTTPDNSQVLVTPQGWYVPQPCETYHQATITQWEEGRTDEWDAENAAYLNYLDIMAYDACVLSPPEEGCGSKPQGYYTQEEATASENAHAQWTVDKAAWETDPENSGVPYPVAEPVILLIPADLTPVPEPTPSEDNLVPNIIEPYDKHYGLSLAEVIENAIVEIKSDTKSHIYASISAESQQNASLGLLPQEQTDCIKEQISVAMTENETFKTDVEALTTNAEIDAYLDNISRTLLDECRPAGV